MNNKTYEDFINSKKKVKQNKGIIVKENELNDQLFDWQKAIVKRALEKMRYCMFEECGMGKTVQQLEYAYQIVKHTNKPVLILAPLGVVTQTQLEEAPKLGYQVHRISADLKNIDPGIYITNYEQIENIDTKPFVGVILDESSILKNFTGKVRNKLIAALDHTKYRLCCSATPAPNDLMELLNQADFLGITTTAKALATYFINDMKTGSYRLKGHATKDFYRWCATWSINISSPKDLGYKAEYYKLPKLNEKEVMLETDMIDYNFENGFFRDVETSATSFHKEKKRTAKARAKKCAEIVAKNNDQYLIWCDTNYEADLLKKYIPTATEVRGSDSNKKKESSALQFKSGDIRVLISKPKIFGYGMNFQKCHNVIFCGLTYSYENYYQALRRIWRFGQEQEVNSYIVIGSTEYHILETIKKKRDQQKELKNNMDQSIKEIQLLHFTGKEELRHTAQNKIDMPKFLNV